MGKWYADNKLFFSYPGHDMDRSTSDLHDYLKNFIQSKIGNLHNLNILDAPAQKSGVIGIICTSDECKISFPDILDNEGEQLYFVVNKGATFTFRDTVKHIAEYGEWYEYNYDTEPKEILGEGQFVYEVISTVKDEYRIKVKANSENEAIDFAKHIEVSKWDHPDIDPEIPDAIIIRHAKWGRFSASQCPQ